ncbi:cation diffusion facilitator family transporter [Vibrio vulnificus]|nr:cation diffusion facilitator family transporter [Vibrio vulnificus]
MCDRTTKNENRILTFSALAASGFAVAGLVLGMFAGSLVIMFDGVYSLVSLLLTLLSLAASYYINTPSQRLFPFGKAVLEPIVIAIKAIVILMVVAYSLYSAVFDLFNGGREVNTSVAIFFETSCVIGCAYVWWYISRKSRQYSSGLIAAEVKQWQMDALLSAVVTIGFIMSIAVTYSPYAEFAAYADPVMMLAMSFYFIKVPMGMLKEALRELLMMSPDEELCRSVGNDIEFIEKQTSQHLKLAGVAKVGQELRVNVDLHVKNKTLALAELESTRNKLKKQLSKHPFKLQLNVNVAF